MNIRKEHFSICDKKHYPPFFRVIQSIYSPFLGNVSPYDEGGKTPMTSLLSLGLWRNDKKRYGMSICSIIHRKISDPSQLIDQINSSKKDYLNKTTNRSEYNREAKELLIERKRSEKGPFPLYGEIEDYAFFFPEYNGGDNLSTRLTLAMPLFKKIHLMTKPDDEDELRIDDRYLISTLMSYPSSESHSLLSALSQAIIYADRKYFR